MEGLVISKQLIDKGFQIKLYDPYFFQKKTISTINTIIFLAAKYSSIFTNLKVVNPNFKAQWENLYYDSFI